MPASTLFPGMDPYLERRGLWEDVHTRLIVAIADALEEVIHPKYRASVEQRTYLSVLASEARTGRSDVAIALNEARERYEVRPAASNSGFHIAELPMPEEMLEHYLEIRRTEHDEVVTVIELLSPTNKTTREGRAEYEKKRMKILQSDTHLVEIDLIRAGQPFPFTLQNKVNPVSDYRITISRAQQRPQANVYLFSLREIIPDFQIPLLRGDVEPTLFMNQILHSLFERAHYAGLVGYDKPLTPPLSAADTVWFATLLQK